MVSNQSITMIESIVRAAGATTKADKTRILESVQNVLGLTQTDSAKSEDDIIIPLTEAIHQLSYKSTRTLRNHLRAGTIVGFYPGAQRKRCTGVRQSEIDRFKQRHKESTTPCEA